MARKDPSRIQVWKMFDAIAPTYDRVNRVMSFGFDLYWRWKVAQEVPEGADLLDCATGTGDQLISALKMKRLGVAIGIDLSQEMLEIGRKKLKKYRGELRHASVLEIPFEEKSFDCVTISFGIRNVVDVRRCLEEMLRVLKPGGKVLILESSMPQGGLIKALHLPYLRYIMPRLGGWISKKKDAYRYLNETIETFLAAKTFCALMEQAGFARVKARRMTGGVVTLYSGERPE